MTMNGERGTQARLAAALALACALAVAAARPGRARSAEDAGDRPLPEAVPPAAAAPEAAPEPEPEAEPEVPGPEPAEAPEPPPEPPPAQATAAAGAPFETALFSVNGRPITASYLDFCALRRDPELAKRWSARAAMLREGAWQPEMEIAWRARMALAARAALQQAVLGELLRVQAREADRKRALVRERQLENYWRRRLPAGGPAQLASETGMSVAALKESARDELLTEVYARALTDALARPTPEELRRYHRDNAESFRCRESVRARAVFVRRFVPDGAGGGNAPRAGAEARAAEILARILDGREDFASAARRFSEDPPSAARDGLLEGGRLIPRGTYAAEPELEKALFESEPGRPGGVVKGGKNLYLVLVEKRVPEGVLPFEEVEPEVFRRCWQERKARALDRFFRDNYHKVLLLDAEGRRVPLAYFRARRPEAAAGAPARP